MWEWVSTFIFIGVYYILIRGARRYEKERDDTRKDWTELTEQHHKLMYHFNQTVIELQHYRDIEPEEHTIMQFNLPEK